MRLGDQMYMVLIIALIFFVSVGSVFVVRLINRKQVRKWEDSLNDGQKSLQIQTEILSELKLIRQLLEKT